MSSRLASSITGSDLAVAINSLKTIQSANVVASISNAAAVCQQSLTTTTNIVLKAESGNIPRLGLWTSVVDNFHSSWKFTTANTSDTLVLSVADGRDGSVKICNGLGRCDYSTGSCQCSEVRKII